MKKLLIFYLFILLPLVALIWLMKTDIFSSRTSVFLLFFYSLIYRTFTDGKRLYDKHLILKKDIWKLVLPGRRFTYFKELYLEK